MTLPVKAIADPGLPPRATPKNFLVAWLLVLLRRSHLHGYEIMKELRDEFGIACEHGALYRTLHQLEAGGMIRSHWDTHDLGPARRVYELTDTGDAALVAWSDALGGYRASLEKFFHLYQGLTGA
jgi:PadR family transcriptional regulator, regulatory protein PadR